ncbi:NAD(P)H-dependent oxidoreductase subunit E [Planctomycetota bacterium]
MKKEQVPPAEKKPVDAEIERTARSYEGDPSALIQLLLDVQAKEGFLSQAWLRGLSVALEIPLTRVYQVATFYKAFNLKPRGRHTVQICTGTACHVRGGPQLLKRIAGMLAVKPGETTKDGEFTLETVNCLGCCALGPVVSVDNKYYSNPTPDDMKSIFDGCRKVG